MLAETIDVVLAVGKTITLEGPGFGEVQPSFWDAIGMLLGEKIALQNMDWPKSKVLRGLIGIPIGIVFAMIFHGLGLENWPFSG